jgi:hypothetical protein
MVTNAKDNVYAQLARERKVARVLGTLRTNGWATPDMVACMHDEHWHIVAKLAGVHDCSATTRRLIAEQIEREHAAPSAA